MSIRELEEKLFDEWQKKEKLEYNIGNKKIFVRDGLVDEESYFKAPVKILYLLKEVNGGDRDWDLREYVKNGGRATTWDNITRWTKGIFRYREELEWNSLENINKDSRKGTLKHIIAVNLKKIPGGHTTDYKKLEDFLKKESNVNYLKQQILLYNPDIIVCCGTGWLYSNYIEKGMKWAKTKRGILYNKENNKLIISYSHPEARVSSNLLYYGLIDAIKEIF
ncbi:hypothetical protein [Fusobacterium hwasookii]|uniref:Uracil-DNA glycosylase-like domain-containing protein n=1 Tax=Fusobacterium hwasookii ChDC F128 TaxID=1216362 RepID=A0ABN0GY70_9FUSO|nr:hypothetical protein [Fusobacterium hwasookii]EJU06886.1 hypothetical protein B437_09800 [Fusobacterium hwasookii ChDC F128]QNE66843.1 hypothetical protein H5V36_02870 [Fusobacterium hwasookii]